MVNTCKTHTKRMCTNSSTWQEQRQKQPSQQQQQQTELAKASTSQSERPPKVGAWPHQCLPGCVGGCIAWCYGRGTGRPARQFLTGGKDRGQLKQRVHVCNMSSCLFSTYCIVPSTHQSKRPWALGIHKCQKSAIGAYTEKQLVRLMHTYMYMYMNHRIIEIKGGMGAYTEMGVRLVVLGMKFDLNPFSCLSISSWESIWSEI